MKYTLKITVGFLVSLIYSITAAGQGKLTLRDCIDLGLEKNYSIRIARNQQQITDNNATRGNAGQLPTLDLGATFGGTYYDYDNRLQDGTRQTVNNHGSYVDLGPSLGWTLFNGFSATTDYRRLQELASIGELDTRRTLEDFIASVAEQYYTLIRQEIRLSNLRASVRLSKERLRIVEESYHIGASSGIDFQQAQVDFNADNSALISQMELVQRLQIELNEVMGVSEVERRVSLADTTIVPNVLLDREQLWGGVKENNSSLMLAEKNKTVSELDLRKAKSRNYPYLRVAAGYGYRHSWDNYSAYETQDRLGLNYSVSAGITIFDGMNRRREQRNARLEIENRQLYIDQLKLALRSDMAAIWLAYTNNLKLWDIERENLVVARSNFEVAMERYRLRELSGIELREAQLSLLQSEERLSTVEYNIKMCEISLYQLRGEILDKYAGEG